MMTDGANSSRRTAGFLIGGLVVALLVAGVLSFYASSQPDGLEKVADETGFLGTAEQHGTADSPLAEYGVKDVDNARLSVGLAGVIGVATTFAVGFGVFFVVRRLRSGSTPPATT
jgi:cobalt/nickel transport system permease protein